MEIEISAYDRTMSLQEEYYDFPILLHAIQNKEYWPLLEKHRDTYETYSRKMRKRTKERMIACASSEPIQKAMNLYRTKDGLHFSETYNDKCCEVMWERSWFVLICLALITGVTF